MSTAMSDPGSPATRVSGLEGVIAATTALSKVDGTTGRLTYRGYNIHDLAQTTNFEEVAHLLWFGHLPNRKQLTRLMARFAAERSIPNNVMQIIRALPTSTEPMDALRTAVSAWGAGAISGKPTIDQAIALTARFPLFLAAFQRIRHGHEPLQPKPELGQDRKSTR